jgi:hypothetical protein
MWLYPLPFLFNKSSLVPIPINCEIPPTMLTADLTLLWTLQRIGYSCDFIVAW